MIGFFNNPVLAEQGNVGEKGMLEKGNLEEKVVAPAEDCQRFTIVWPEMVPSCFAWHWKSGITQALNFLRSRTTDNGKHRDTQNC